jgi:hypothetical protein
MNHKHQQTTIDIYYLSISLNINNYEKDKNMPHIKENHQYVEKTNGARCEMLRRVESFPIRSLSDAVPWAEAVGLLHRLIATNTWGFP